MEWGSGEIDGRLPAHLGEISPDILAQGEPLAYHVLCWNMRLGPVMRPLGTKIEFLKLLRLLNVSDLFLLLSGKIVACQ